MEFFNLKLNNQMTNTCPIAVLLIIGLIGCINSSKEKPNSSANVIREIDMIRLTDLNGQSVSLNQYQGKTIEAAINKTGYRVKKL